MCVVCVCVFVPPIGGSPSVQGERCATLCSVSRGLHLFSVFAVQLEPTGVTQEGVNTGASFFFLYFFYAPPSSCGACLHFLSREGFGRPCPSSTPQSNFVYSRRFPAINRFPLPGTKVRENPLSPRFEPVTWLPEVYWDTNWTTGATGL